MVTGVLEHSTIVPKKTSERTTVPQSSLLIAELLRAGNEDEHTLIHRRYLKRIRALLDGENLMQRKTQLHETKSLIRSNGNAPSYKVKVKSNWIPPQSTIKTSLRDTDSLLESTTFLK